MNMIELHPEFWAGLLARRARLPHALLLSGQRGIGKFALARQFAESLLCEQPGVAQEACGHCAACGWLRQGNHPDFRLLQPEALAGEAAGSEPDASGSKKKPSQQITIDQIRDLDEFLHVGTHRQGARIVLIHPAEAMNRATANAILKSLEEPIPGTLFLLVCLIRGMKGDFTPDHHFGFEAAAWYWHFVDVVWLFLFIFVYIWGSGPGPYHG